MTRTPRAASYLGHMARHHDSHLPLLTPPRMLVQQRGTAMPHEIAVETILPTQPSSLRTGTIPFSQASPFLSPQHMTRLPARGQEEVTVPSSPHLPELYIPEKTASIGSKQPQVEILPPPAKAKHIDAVATQATSDRQARASGSEKTARVILRPHPMQQQETAAITATNRGRTTDFPGQESKTGAINSEQQHATIHIGTIDIQIVPPAPAVSLPPRQSMTTRPRPTSALSREMTSFIGLRQG